MLTCKIRDASLTGIGSYQPILNRRVQGLSYLRKIMAMISCEVRQESKI